MAYTKRNATPPRTYWTVAIALKAVRTHVWTSAQLSILDVAIDAICDGLHEINPRFDSSYFKTVAGYRTGRDS